MFQNGTVEVATGWDGCTREGVVEMVLGVEVSRVRGALQQPLCEGLCENAVERWQLQEESREVMRVNGRKVLMASRFRVVQRV